MPTQAPHAEAPPVVHAEPQRESASAQRANVMTSDASGPAVVPLPETPARPLRKRALLVGINDYKYNDGIVDLRGCLRDVANMRDVLVKNHGFAEQDVVVLADSQSTAAGIVKSFDEHLIAKSDGDTVAVFYFSGHGSQMRDADGDEADGYDETIVTYDSAHEGTSPNLDLTDDVLHDLLRRLSEKTRHVTAIVDACHSGTVSRAVAIPRRAPADHRDVAKVGTRARGTDGLGERDGRGDELPYTLISGAQSNELAYERAIGGDHSGVMTWHLAEALRRPRTDLTLRDVMDEVKGNVSSLFSAQHPQIEGRGQDAVVFGTAEHRVEPFVAVRVVAGKLELAAGKVHGVTKKSVFGLYGATRRIFEPTGLLMKARVSHVGDVTSELTPVVARAKLTFERARAVEHEHHFEGRPILVFVDGKGSEPVLSELRLALADETIASETKDRQAADLIVVGAAGAVEVDAPDGEPLVPLIPAGPQTVEQAMNAVRKWARWLSLRALDNPATVNEPLLLTVPAARDAAAAAVAMQTRITAGQVWRFGVDNQTTRPWFLTLLALSGDGSISIVYPRSTSSEVFAPRTTWFRELQSCTPRGRIKPLLDTVKVFFTESPTDFSFLSQGPITRSAARDVPTRRNPFRTLIESAAGARGQTDVTLTSGSWATRKQTIEIVPKPGAAECL